MCCWLFTSLDCKLLDCRNYFFLFLKSLSLSTDYLSYAIHPWDYQSKETAIWASVRWMSHYFGETLKTAAWPERMEQRCGEERSNWADWLTDWKIFNASLRSLHFILWTMGSKESIRPVKWHEEMHVWRRWGWQRYAGWREALKSIKR